MHFCFNCGTEIIDKKELLRQPNRVGFCKDCAHDACKRTGIALLSSVIDTLLKYDGFFQASKEEALIATPNGPAPPKMVNPNPVEIDPTKTKVKVEVGQKWKILGDTYEIVALDLINGRCDAIRDHDKQEYKGFGLIDKDGYPGWTVVGWRVIPAPKTKIEVGQIWMSLNSRLTYEITKVMPGQAKAEALRSDGRNDRFIGIKLDGYPEEGYWNGFVLISKKPIGSKNMNNIKVEVGQKWTYLNQTYEITDINLIDGYCHAIDVDTGKKVLNWATIDKKTGKANFPSVDLWEVVAAPKFKVEVGQVWAHIGTPKITYKITTVDSKGRHCSSEHGGFGSLDVDGFPLWNLENWRMISKDPKLSKIKVAVGQIWETQSRNGNEVVITSIDKKGNVGVITHNGGDSKECTFGTIDNEGYGNWYGWQLKTDAPHASQTKIKVGQVWKQHSYNKEFTITSIKDGIVMGKFDDETKSLFWNHLNSDGCLTADVPNWRLVKEVIVPKPAVGQKWKWISDIEPSIKGHVFTLKEIVDCDCYFDNLSRRIARINKDGTIWKDNLLYWELVELEDHNTSSAVNDLLLLEKLEAIYNGGDSSLLVKYPGLWNEMCSLGYFKHGEYPNNRKIEERLTVHGYARMMELRKKIRGASEIKVGQIWKSPSGVEYRISNIPTTDKDGTYLISIDLLCDGFWKGGYLCSARNGVLNDNGESWVLVQDVVEPALKISPVQPGQVWKDKINNEWRIKKIINDKRAIAEIKGCDDQWNGDYDVGLDEGYLIGDWILITNSQDIPKKLKKNPKRQFTLRETIKEDIADAGYRVAANQLTKGAHAAISKLLESRGYSSEKIKIFIELLDTDFGKSLVGMILGMSLTYTPQLKTNTHAQKLAREFRVGSMSTMGNAMANYILPAIMDSLSEDNVRIAPEVRVEEQEELVLEEEANKEAYV